MASRDADDRPGPILDVRAGDVADALLRRNPTASLARVERTARVMAAIGARFQRRDGERDGPGAKTAPSLTSRIERVVTETDADGKGAREPDGASVVQLTPGGEVERHRGTGLGERVNRKDGRRRLEDHALPLSLEDWAGPLAGPTELSDRLGIARSTLQDWRRSGAVIGLLKGTRKHVFPLGQFVDGRPVEGIGDVLALTGDPRVAWLWLVEPRRGGGSPLDDLKRGRVAAVVATAHEDFA